MKKIFLSSLALLAFANTSFANDNAYYVRGDVGYSIFNKTKISNTEFKTSNFLVYNAGIGGILGNNVRGEINFQASHNAKVTNNIGNSSYQIGMIRGFYDFAFKENYLPYVGMGFGISNIKFTSNSSIYNSYTKTGLAFDLSAGLGYKISENGILDIGCRFLSLNHVYSTQVLTGIRFSF